MAECQSKNIIWTAESIAKYLGVSRNKFYNLIEMGLPVIVIDGRWCAHADNLEAFFKLGTAKGTKKIPKDAE